MISIYNIKPAFQSLLRPLVKLLAKIGIKANQVTLFACILSLITWILLAIFGSNHLVFWLVPIVFLFRMALNAIDGMLAREHNQKSALGGVLNELTDMISDAALYLPFALLTPHNPYLVFIVIIFSLLTEAAGLTTFSVGASRRYDGPMGKSDRAFVFSVIAILIASGIQAGLWLTYVWGILIILLSLTIIFRINRGLKELKNGN